MLLGTNNEYAKAYNLRIVLETIRRKGPVSRAEIARLTALTRPTISTIVQQLISDGLVAETGQRQGKRGSPSTQLELNPAGAFSIGIDLDRDHLTAVLMNFTGTVQNEIRQDLDFPTPAQGLDLMVEVTEQLIGEQTIARDRLFGVGVGFPGPLSVSADAPYKTVVAPLNFPGWQNVPVAHRLGERLDLPVILENNATAAAMGESWYGGAQHIQSFFYVYFGVGLGGGAILNGQPYDGFRGNAGELGYLPVELPERTTHLGELLHLPWLYRDLKEAGHHAHAPHDLDALYAQQEPQLLEWLEQAAHYLAPALIVIEHLFDPEAIILGGRLPNALLDHLLAAVGARLPHLRKEGKPYPTTLLRAQVGEHAAALGLAALPIYQAVAPSLVHLLKERPLEPQHSPVSWLAGR